MGRTPLFRLLQRAAAIARASRHVRMPLDEFHDLVRTQRIDRRRRRLLQGAAAGLIAGHALALMRRQHPCVVLTTTLAPWGGMADCPLFERIFRSYSRSYCNCSGW